MSLYKHDDYDWYGIGADKISEMKIKGRKGQRYLSLTINVPLDPFLKGTEDLGNMQGRINWGIKKK